MCHPPAARHARPAVSCSLACNLSPEGLYQNLFRSFFFLLLALQVRIGGYQRTLDTPSDYDLRRTVRTVWHPGFVWGYKPDQVGG